MLTSLGSRLDRALRGVYDLCAVFAGLAIITIALAVIASIGSRFAGIYLPGTTEIAGYGMAAAGSLGLAHTAMHHGHIRVDLVLSRLHETTRNRVEILASLCATAAIGFTAWAVCRFTASSFRFGDLSSNSDGLPLWIPQAPVAIGFTAFTVSLAHLLVLSLLGRNTVPTAPEQGPQQ